MNRPNLFDFATSELSQDAFICWLLKWADRQYRVTDEKLHQTALELMNRLLALHGIEPLAACNVNVSRQREDIDILALINEDLALLIEDKTDTSEHSNQLQRYLETVKVALPNKRAVPIYMKTGDQSSLLAVENAGWKCFGRRDILSVLEYGEQNGVKNHIFDDFHDRLKRIENAVQEYQHCPVSKWEKVASRWVGFFTALQEKLGDGDWGRVAFPGNFMGFWWHRNENKYLLLKEDKLCFKINVLEKADQALAWHSWHDSLVAESRKRGITIQRPGRRASGKNMTVAEMDNYLQVDSAGILDLDRTVAFLKLVEDLLDAAVATTHANSNS